MTLPLPDTAETEAGCVRYAVLGEGPPVVLVHGTPTSSYIWRKVAPWLARDFTVYVYDLPGYGHSAKFDGQDVSMALQGRVLARLLDVWGLSAPAIAAHDIGGGIVLRAHLLHDAALGRLALLDTLAMRPRGGGRWGTSWSRHCRNHGTAAFEALPEYLHVGILRPYLRTALHRPVTDTELEPLIAPWRGAQGQAAFYRQIRQLDEAYTDDIELRLHAVAAPAVQILWGEEDTWLDFDFAERLHAAIPGSSLRYLPGAGHFCMEDAPAAVALELRRFFQAAA